ncbi:MAG: hypothetical protein Q4C68_03495 [Moraxella sp.]|nr:hypothetical protein [Moraxella sp.]
MDRVTKDDTLYQWNATHGRSDGTYPPKVLSWKLPISHITLIHPHECYVA